MVDLFWHSECYECCYWSIGVAFHYCGRFYLQTGEADGSCCLKGAMKTTLGPLFPQALRQTGGWKAVTKEVLQGNKSYLYFLLTLYFEAFLVPFLRLEKALQSPLFSA